MPANRKLNTLDNFVRQFNPIETNRNLWQPNLVVPGICVIVEAFQFSNDKPVTDLNHATG